MQQYQLVSRWIRGDIPGKILPWQIDLDTTNICNQACFYCNTEKFRRENPTFQTTEKYLKLIDELYNWRKHDPNIIGTLSNVIFSGGGEPTLLPGYENIIEKCIDSGYVCAMNTNGTKLDKLLKLPIEKIRKMAYIGLDLDSGNPQTYELIRRSKMATPFYKIKELAKHLGDSQTPIDIKCLLMEYNTTDDEIQQLFEYAKHVNCRSIHFRPVILNDKIFEVTEDIEHTIKRYSEVYGVDYHISKNRYEERKYSKCHQFFLFPSFSADGNIYLCCEYKGVEKFRLGSWSNDDWRDLWCSDRHKKMYNEFITDKCKMCRPNPTNNKIEDNLQHYPKVIEGFI